MDIGNPQRGHPPRSRPDRVYHAARRSVTSWYLKARIEERFLREELGQNAYGNYAARVPMLLPFAPL
jgi:hypothetical protein